MSKKLIIAFSALALAILAGAIAVVGVFAAQQQKVANTFTITYTANNVKADIWAQYKTAKSTVNSVEDDSGSIAVLTFEPQDASQTKSFNLDQIENLTASNDYVILYFFIYNKNSRNGKNISASLSCSATYQNVYIWFGTGLPTTDSEARMYLSVHPDSFDPSTHVEPATISPQQEVPFYFVIKIKDNTLPASFVSTAEKGINITLNAV